MCDTALLTLSSSSSLVLMKTDGPVCIEKYASTLFDLSSLTFVMILMVIHLAFRLSLLDERCRRMAVEIALMGAGGGSSAPAKIMASASFATAPQTCSRYSLSETVSPLAFSSR